ncbi:MAG: hypothetical protein RBS80_23460 [Thermoguttaceae bacterium]|jgi:hypothetical protein|nr:hypothetical protein [Thermoguttaceae bacterium]
MAPISRRQFVHATVATTVGAVSLVGPRSLIADAPHGPNTGKGEVAGRDLRNHRHGREIPNRNYCDQP